MAAAPALIGFIGFGEAATAFAAGLAAPRIAFDRQPKHAQCAALGVLCAPDSASVAAAAPLILSLVTAGNALEAARAAAASIAPGTLYCDMNSVAPDTKRAAASLIEAACGRYADVAVMAPVHPACRAVPLLIAGPHAEAARMALAAAGFSRARAVPGPVGAASSIKMIRSVLVKGLEALTTECTLAASRAGVLEEVIASLNANWPGVEWADKADYNLDRMMVHGHRRAEEMEEVVKTLDALGTGAAMSRATAACQQQVGRQKIAPPATLPGKIAAVLAHAGRRAA